jgi:hypothetical protein
MRVLTAALAVALLLLVPAILLAAAALAATAALGSAAYAHGNAEWIQRGGYRNAAGELCCGERDCFEVPADDVAIVPHGYMIKSRNEFVPHAEAQPSPDGHYWRCEWSGERKCFFAPPPSMS